MKLLLNFYCLLLCLSVYGQDSTKQKFPLFKVSGVSILTGSSLNFGISNQQFLSKQALVSVFREVTNRPYYNYANFNCTNGNYGGMFGAYLSFDNYSKKKNRYAIHSQTNVGVTVFGHNGLYANFNNTTSTRIDTLFVKSGATYIPSYYHDNVTTNYAYVSYHSTNVGIDVQQVLTTNQKRIVSLFVGLGASVNFSAVSQISERQGTETGINLTPYPNYNYQSYLANNTALLSKSTYSNESANTYNIKSSVLYQIYTPFGFNIRLGKNDKKTISHFYFITQARVSYSVFKIQSINAFLYTTSYATIGVKYRF